MIYSAKQSGFSLVETLVAVTILLIVIVGPMTILTTTSNSTSFATEQVTAFFLAQEGVELAQLARDNEVLNRFLPNTDGNYDATPWSGFTEQSSGNPYFSGGCYSGSGCGLYIDDSTTPTVQVNNCSTEGACDIYFDDDFSGNVRFRYTHDSSVGGATDYSRQIFFEDLGGSGDEIRVRSVVEWFPSNSRNPRTVEVETVLINVYGL
jgi:prepilin-type N-terminal cleavage/methylation domain-containing protein